jgi:methyl-accepting chemotaxis protein
MSFFVGKLGAYDWRVLVTFLVVTTVVVTANLVWMGRRVLKRLGGVAETLRDAVRETRQAAGQVSETSTQLASGTSEQASSLARAADMLSQMAEQARSNSHNVQMANHLGNEAKTAAVSGGQTVAELTEAMGGIKEASDQISNIIKVIEEIAFQTNLLALNAAVEAARAGEHGKGFAVVAEEVRSLAQRSAEAVRETTALIEQATTRSQQGVKVTGQVSEVFSSIVADIGNVTELINSVSQASQEQAREVDEANGSVSQIDAVTQRNAAIAEESAAGAQTLESEAQIVSASLDELLSFIDGVRR